MSDCLLVERRPLEGDDAVAIVTLNRPDSLNAIDRTMIDELDRVLDGIEADRDTRAVLITGAGRAFCAGGDLKGYVTLQRDPVAFPAFVEALHNAFGRLRRLPVPVVALVNGVTAAGGLELLLNCDLAFASDTAKIGDAHLNYGQMGGGGVLTLLPRIVGIQRASELIYSGAFVDAGEAQRIGLVAKVVPADELLATGLEFARAVARKSPLAVLNAKEVMNQLWLANGSVDAGLRLERERNNVYCLTSDDAPEGLAAFSEKRAPRFGRRP